jgi:rSAM/selenodomain-associated transferase 1
MVELAGERVLAVLTRAPSAAGKTRLFADLGVPPDPRLLSALLLDTVDGAAASGVPIVVAVTPAAACDEVRALLLESQAPDAEVIAQPDGGLGERMRATMAALFARGAAAVALIGSDLPHIGAAPIGAAFAALADEPAALVLGPAGDGGYYLIAATRVPDVFEAIEWGTPQVLEQTRRLAADRGIPIRLVATLDDVDSAGDLRRAAAGGLAPRTAAWIRATLH